MSLHRMGSPRRRRTRDAALVLVVLVVAGVLVPMQATPTELVVDASRDGAFPSIADALRKASPGDRIHLASGVHRGPVAITTAGVTLDAAAGAMIDAAGGDGITVRADDVTLRGITMWNGSRGVVVEDAQGVRLEGVRVTKARGAGIDARSTSALVMWDTIVDSTGGPAVRVRDAAHLVLLGLDVTSTGGGLLMDDVRGARVDDVVAHANVTDAAVAVAASSHIALANVTAPGSARILDARHVDDLIVTRASGIPTSVGATLTDVNRVRVTDLRVHGNDTASRGFVVDGATNVSVSAVVENLTGDAVTAGNVTDLRVDGATIRHVGTGVRVTNATNVTVIRTTVSNASGDGVAVTASRGVHLMENGIQDAPVGLRLHTTAEDVEVARNKVRSMRGAGILLENGTRGAEVHNNTVTASVVGIRLTGNETRGNVLSANVLAGNVLDLASENAASDNRVAGGSMDGACHVLVRGGGRLVVEGVATDGPLKASGAAETAPGALRTPCFNVRP